MSKYVVSWADDSGGLHLSVSVYETLEEARKPMMWYWNEILKDNDLPEGTESFDFTKRFGPHGEVCEMGMWYRDAEGFGDEVEITEVQS